MRYVFLVLAIVVLTFALLIEAAAESAIHEILAAVLFISFAVLLVGYQVASLAAELRRSRRRR